MSGLFDGADIIHSYTRAQAIEDGTLIDVSETAREAGITFPVAVTRAVWEDCVAWPDDEQAPQDESGRLWDVVWMLRFGVQRAAPGADVIRYELLRVPRGGDHAVKVGLKAVCGPGDEAEPVITVMQPQED